MALLAVGQGPPDTPVEMCRQPGGRAEAPVLRVQRQPLVTRRCPRECLDGRQSVSRLQPVADDPRSADIVEPQHCGVAAVEPEPLQVPRAGLVLRRGESFLINHLWISVVGQQLDRDCRRLRNMQRRAPGSIDGVDIGTQAEQRQRGSRDAAQVQRDLPSRLLLRQRGCPDVRGGSAGAGGEGAL